MTQSTTKDVRYGYFLSANGTVITGRVRGGVMTGVDTGLTPEEHHATRQRVLGSTTAVDPMPGTNRLNIRFGWFRDDQGTAHTVTMYGRDGAA